MTLNVETVIFWILGVAILTLALGVVRARDIVRSLVALVLMFLLTACIFILAGAEFLALIQALVYVGAISVVILFGVMLTRRTMGDSRDI